MLWFFLALAGALGTLARVGLGELAAFITGSPGSLGVWLANLLGCFLFGLVWVLADERGFISAQARFCLLVGFMGSLTTFSSYIFDCADLMRQGLTGRCILTLAGQNTLGFAALWGGMCLGRAGL